MSDVFGFVPGVRLVALAIFPMVLASMAEAQSANSRAIEPVAAQRFRQHSIKGYELGRPTQSRSSRARTEHFTYRPTIDGVALLNGEVAIHVDSNGRTIQADQSGSPREPRSRSFRVTSVQAGTLAAQSVGAAPSAVVRAKQVYFVAQQTTEPAYQVYIETPGQGAFEAVVSADTGEVLRLTPLTFDGASSGPVFRAPDAPNPAIGSRTVEPLTGWPSSEGACPLDVYPAGSNGECWTAGSATVGNNADACLDVNADNVCDRRALSFLGSFSSLFVNAYELTGVAAPDQDAAMVNAFYWVNALHDWLYRLGFDEASGNFQLDNFGRGGEENDSVSVDVQDGAVINNATFSTAPDGISPRMQLGLYPWSLHDSAFDADLLVHEYVHGLTNRLVGGPANVAALSIWQSGALGEGWSDALAASFTDDPVFGEYASNNPTSGLRTAALDASPYTFGRLGSLYGAVHGPTGRVLPLPQVHADGEIWGAALWDIRESLGRNDFEQTLVDALKLTPVRPSMIDARDAYLQAADLLELDVCKVWAVFAARGLGASAALNPIETAHAADTALSVYESFDQPVACGGTEPVALANLLLEGAESDGSWLASGLWHRSTQRSSTGAYSWRFGQVGTGNYDTGSRVVGDLISPPIDVTVSAAAELSWKQYFRGEGFNSRIDLGGLTAPFLNADSGRVWVSIDDGANWLLITHIVHDTPGTDFVSFRVNLTRFVGETIRLRFDFDTFNAISNDHEGWFLDEIRVDELTTEPPPPPPDPVASWPFEETAPGPGVTITDSSRSGLHGVTAGRGSATVVGPSGSARLFNGFTDSVSMPASAVYTPQQFTVRSWVRLDAYPSALGIIVSTFSGAASTGWYLAVNATGRPIFMPASPPDSAPWLMGTASLQLGRWYYLAASYDASTDQAALYVDGQLQGILKAPRLVPASTTPLTIGKASWTDSYKIRGAIDEVSIVPYLETDSSLTATFSSAAPPTAAANTEASGQWSFDSSTADASGNGHAIIAQSGDFGPGMVGQGLRFDGFNDTVSIANDERLSPASFTISAWVRLLALPLGWGALISNYDGVFSGWYVGVLADGRPFFGLSSLPNSLPSVVGSSPMALGQWTHLAATYEGGSRTLSLYVNGVLASSRQTLGFTPRTSGSLVLGRASWIDTHHTSFDIDELHIRTHALSASAVLADVQSYGGSNEAAVAHWSFDETATGVGVAFGDSVNGHDATAAENRNTPMTGLLCVARRFGGYPDFATVDAHNDFSAESFSFSTWVRLDEPLDKWGVVFSTYDGISSGWFLGVTNDRRPVLSVSGTPGSSPWLTAPQSLVLGRWHHLAVTFEGRERRGIIYIDGVRAASAVFPSWSPSTGFSPHFGRASWSNGAFLRMILDEPTFYGHELTAAEVGNQYALHAFQQIPEPLAQWEFESVSDSGILSDSVGNHHATHEGGGGALISGLSGVFAYSFAGAPVAASVEPHADFAADSFTFSSWVKTSSAPPAWGMIFSNYNGANQGWYLALNTDNRLIFSVSGLPDSNPWLLSSVPIAPDQWTHIAVTFDSVNRRGAIYIGGVLVATAVFPAWTSQLAIGPTFARASWDERYYLDFSIDDARFYGVELSAPDIADLAAEF